MLFRDFSTPSAFGFAFQWFWMTCTSFRMLTQFFYEAHDFIIRFGLMKLQTFNIIYSVLCIRNSIHKSTNTLQEVIQTFAW